MVMLAYQYPFLPVKKYIDNVAGFLVNDTLVFAEILKCNLKISRNIKVTL